MTFDRNNLTINGGNYKTGNTPQTWVYWDEDGDTLTAAGFFADAALKVGDQIDVIATAYTSITRYRVSAVAAGAATAIAATNQVVAPFGVQSLSGTGTINVTDGITLWTTTGANTSGLADGIEGQRKIIKVISDGGEGVVTPTNLLDGSTLTFTEVNDAVELVFAGATWNVVANNGVVVA